MSVYINLIVQWYMEHINYFTITLLMTIESSFIPFPSEIVLPPAAWKAAAGELNLFFVYVSGTAGALIGALINYYIAASLGRIIIYKLADTKIMHLLMINRKSVEKAEDYFNKFGKSSTFIGRLIPAVRQLISIPAGLAKMKITDFLLFTFFGASCWNLILVFLGYFLYSQKEVLQKYYTLISNIFIILGIIFLIFIVYKVIKVIVEKKGEKQE